MEKLETIIASNLIYLRKQAKMTQLEFGEKFNYSDKTVSKWELGTVVPSVETLKEILDSDTDDSDICLCDINSTFQIFFTSGSTGKPKGVIKPLAELTYYLNNAVRNELFSTPKRKHCRNKRSCFNIIWRRIPANKLTWIFI